MTKIAVPEMLRQSYSRRLAFGSVAAAGPIAQMIPPSILMVIYGVITDASVARLPIAGILPGILTALVFMVGIYVIARRNPQIAPPLAQEVTWKESVVALKGAWAIAILALIIMGGIYSGVLTPTEAGAVAAFSALVLGIATKRLTLRHLGEPLAETMRTTGMVFLIIAGAFVFGALLAITRIPFQIFTLPSPCSCSFPRSPSSCPRRCSAPADRHKNTCTALALAPTCPVQAAERSHPEGELRRCRARRPAPRRADLRGRAVGAPVPHVYLGHVAVLRFGRAGAGLARQLRELGQGVAGAAHRFPAPPRAVPAAHSAV